MQLGTGLDLASRAPKVLLDPGQALCLDRLGVCHCSYIGGFLFL